MEQLPLRIKRLQRSVQSQLLMFSSLILSEDNKNDDESSGSDIDMHELGAQHLRDYRDARADGGAPTSPGRSVLLSLVNNHVGLVTSVITTIALSAAVWLQLAVVYPIIFPQHQLDAEEVETITILCVKKLPTLPQTAHPSKKDWSKENCDSVANLNRSFLMKDSCPCWDGKFKGIYSLDKKNVMFNVDAETLGIFAVTVMFTCVTFSGFQKIVHLIVEGSLKYSALIPVAANVHGVYYHWWVSFTYMNESWYYYWYSQWIFGISEFLVMYILFLRLDSHYVLRCNHAAMVIAIATFHSSQGMLTQAVNNIVHWHGSPAVLAVLARRHVTIFAGLHLVARDAAFVFAEVLCVSTIISDARALAALKGRSVFSMWPHLLRNVAVGFAFLWILLSFTTFQEQKL